VRIGGFLDNIGICEVSVFIDEIRGVDYCYEFPLLVELFDSANLAIEYDGVVVFVNDRKRILAAWAEGYA